MASTDDISCTERELVLLRPLDEMSTVVRHAATRWLWDHGITPSSVVVGRPIQRDETQNVLVWREQQPDGSVLKRWRYAPRDGDNHWPARFPESLTDPADARGRVVVGCGT